MSNDNQVLVEEQHDNRHDTQESVVLNSATHDNNDVIAGDVAPKASLLASEYSNKAIKKGFGVLSLVAKLPIVGRLFSRKEKKPVHKRVDAKELTHFPIILQEIDKVYSQTLASGCRVLAITSATKGEGVTLMVKSLALRNILAGRKTLLLDLNFDRPTIGSLLGQDKQGYMQGFGMGVLTLTPEDPLVMRLREPGELHARMQKWLSAYDTIIVDTSPLDTVSFNCFPATIACGAADATLMVVMSARTTQALAVEAVEKLKGCKANLIGTILNDYHNPGLKDELIRKFRWLRRILPPVSRWLESKIRYSKFLSLEI